MDDKPRLPVNFKSTLIKSLAVCALAGAANNAIAAYLDASIGDAIVTNASGVYYNPASLVLIKNRQLVLYGSDTWVHTEFKGTARQTATGYSQTGTATSNTNYVLPSVYLAIPVSNRLTLGFGETYTYYGVSNYSPTSILRYAGTHSYFSAMDLIPSFGFKVTDNFAVGAGLDFELAKIDLYSMSGFPSLGVADRTSKNNANASGVGGHAGLLFQPRLGTAVGLVYHSAVSVNLKGHSDFQSATTTVSSNNFSVKIVAPPSIVLSVNQFVNPKLGFMGTIQRTQWGLIRNLNLRNVAFISGSTGVILPSNNQAYFLRDTWRYSLGTHYKANEKWSFRGSLAYDQSPENPSVQLAAGDNIVVSVGLGYRFTKNLNLDLNYGHIFYKDVNVYTSGTNALTGTTSSSRDGVSGRLTWDF